MLLNSDEPSGIKLRGGRLDSYQPIFAKRGHMSTKSLVVVAANTQPVIYVRLDVPMVDWKMYCINEIEDRSIMFAVDTSKMDSPFDEGQRGYIGALRTNCECCLYEVVQHDIRDGVIRFLAQKIDYLKGSVPPSNIHSYEPPKRGKPPRPKSILNVSVVLKPGMFSRSMQGKAGSYAFKAKKKLYLLIKMTVLA
ncbi:hypothetical protein BVRB_5g123330 [Beta vulgaris subsp. vulgaris]|uniref:Uncharacterized protein n=1 Tax=Beta vulgaris subsp. vulgaris TaxID=3555 RepID=A0A0J8B950_BETVV|nr:hypothetical protein BVRB_5g123330 [Beta vulgaris subsp. vulgaris]